MDDNIFGVDATIDTSTLEHEEQSEDTTQDKDTVTEKEVGTETTETSDAPNEGQGEDDTDSTGESKEDKKESTKPSMILGKFKSENDLKKAYNSLARKVEAEQGLAFGSVKAVTDDLTDDYQQLQSYYTQYKQTKATQATQTSTEENKSATDEAEYESNLIEWYNQEVQSNPVNANAQLAKYMASKELKSMKAEMQQQVNPIIQEREQKERLDTIHKKYEDIGKYSDQMTEEIYALIEEEPELANNTNNDTLLLEKAYFRAKIKSLEEQLAGAFENGKKSATSTKEAKKKINNETNSKQDKDYDSVPDGITIIPHSDGIFF